MGKKFIKSGDPKGSNRVDVKIPKGRYTHLAVVVSGTAVAGEALVKDSIFDARFMRGGTQYQAGDYEDYDQLMNIWGGYPEFTAPTAGAQYAVAFIPFGYKPTDSNYFPNTADIRDNNEAQLELKFNADLDTVFGANDASYEVWGLTNPSIPETYRLHLVQRHQEAGGKGRHGDDWTGPNVGAIFLRDDADVVNSVQIDVDGKTVEDNVDDDFIRATTSLFNSIEASGFGLAQVEILTPGLVPSTTNSNVEFEADFSGAGTLELFYLAFEWGTGGDSVAQVRSEIARKARGGPAPAGASRRG